MNKIIFLTIALLLWLPFLLHAQSLKNNADSLRNALSNATTDSARFDLMNQLSIHYLEDKRDSSVYYLDKVLELAKKNNYTLDVARTLDSKGYVLMHSGKLPQSLKCFFEAVKIAENPDNENKSFYKKSKEGAKKYRLKILASIHHDWGHLMGSINLDEQIFHYKQTEKISSEIKDTNMLGFVNMNLGAVNIKLRKYDTAMIMEQTAEKVFIQTNDKRYLGYVYLLIGEIIIAKNKNKQQAIPYFHRAVDISLSQNNLTNASVSYRKLCDYYLNERNHDSSLYYAKKLLIIQQSMKADNLGDAYSLLYKSFQLTNNKDSAYKYQGLAIVAKDSGYEKQIRNLNELQKSSFIEQQRLQQVIQERQQYQSKLRNYVLLGILGIFLIVGVLLFRNNRQKQKANLVLLEQKQKVESTLQELKQTQSQLIQSEKMASLGELIAGIAHEIQNPLNFVNNFSEVNKELLVEMKDGLKKGNIEEVNSLADDVIDNEDKIIFHGKRADAIVKGMLQHSRSSSGQKEPTDINALCDEYLRLCYHGLRAKDKSFNATMKTDFDERIDKINIVPQDIGRVVLNLLTNAFYVVDEKKKQQPENYEPLVTVTTKRLGSPLGDGGKVEIKVADNGNGIPQKVLDKIFQPFFTTKPTGQGTGLGLSLSYDIIKAHGGEIKVETKEGEGSEFIIQLPIV